MMNEINPHAYRVWIDGDDERRRRIREVATISLAPDANFDDYILASVSVLNWRHYGPIDPDITLSTLSHVATYDTWLSDDKNPPTGYNRYSSTLRDAYFKSVGRLVESGLIDNPNNQLILTDLGKHALGSVVVPEVVSFV